MGTADDFLSDPYAYKEGAVPLDGLPKADRNEILEDMQDWETYMFCKEALKNSKEMPINDIPSVRRCNFPEDENFIRFRVYDERSKTKDLASRIGENFYSNYEKFPSSYTVLSDSVNIEMNSRENWDEEYKECVREEERELMFNERKLQKAKGNEAYAAGKYEKACEYYSNCIQLGGDLLDAYNNRAQANMKMNNFTSAVPDLNKVLQADPENIKALFRRATCRKQLKMYREALKDIDKLLSLNPGSCSSKKLREEIGSIISTLKGRTYRLRENFGSRETFQVVEGQLTAYAEANRKCIDYVMEIDRTGCLKTCVCNFCTEDDRTSLKTNNSLRIGNRPKWTPVTFKLLDEMKIKCCSSSENHNKAANQNAVMPKIAEFDSSTTKIERVTPRQWEEVPEYFTKVSDTFKNRGINMNSVNTKSPRILLRDTQPQSIEKIFGDVLNESILTDIMNSICTDFDHGKEWILMSEYLKEVARLKNFNHYLKRVDKRTRNDISNILDSASRQNPIEADFLKTLYCS